MPIILDATPGGIASNSFTTVAEADAYLVGQLFTDLDWEGADADTKARALVTATRLISTSVLEWLGWPWTYTQALPFPRSGIYTRIGGTIAAGTVPSDLKNATAEYARQLVVAKKMPDTPSDTIGLKSLTAGPVELEFDASTSTAITLPSGVWDMIRHFTLTSSSVNRPVFRT